MGLKFIKVQPATHRRIKLGIAQGDYKSADEYLSELLLKEVQA